MSDQRLWGLVKNGQTALAITREIPGVGCELRYYWRDELRKSQVSRTSVELAAAASAKREELLKAGWVDAPPSWQMGPMT